MENPSQIANYDLAEIEAHARRLRAQAMRHGVRTVKKWVAERLSAVLHVAQSQST